MPSMFLSRQFITVEDEATLCFWTVYYREDLKEAVTDP